MKKKPPPREENIDEWAERLFAEKKQPPMCIVDGKKVIPKGKYKTYR